jgi:membrane associated rhomboid family serine protease
MRSIRSFPIHSFFLAAAWAVGCTHHDGGGLSITVEAAFHPISFSSPLPSRLVAPTVYPSRLFSRSKGSIHRRCATLMRRKSVSTSRSTDAPSALFSIRLDDNHNGNLGSKATSSRKTTMVHALLLLNLVVFLADKMFHVSLVRRNLYLFHAHWKWWQPLTSCFCHADRMHLSNNLFLLLLFGRSVQDDFGSAGLLFCYVLCGVVSSWVSLFLLPKYTVSIGASGAVFGLFAISMLSKLSWREILDWRKVVELAVLGEFVVRQVTLDFATAVSGGQAGINHVAHLSGAAAGAIMVLGMRMTVARFERAERARQGA